MSPGTRAPASLKTSARIVVWLASVVSVALTLYAGRHNSSALLVSLFVLWVALPYAGMFYALRVASTAVAGIASAMRASLMVIAGGSVFIYALAALFPLHKAAAFPFLAVPGVSLVALGLLLLSTRVVRRRY